MGLALGRTQSSAVFPGRLGGHGTAVQEPQVCHREHGMGTREAAGLPSAVWGPGPLAHLAPAYAICRCHLWTRVFPPVPTPSRSLGNLEAMSYEVTPPIP